MILALIEHDRGTLNRASLEMITLGRALAETAGEILEGMVIGENGRSIIPTLANYGLGTIHLVQHDRLDDYAPEAWAQSAVQVMESEEPTAVLAAGTERGNELMAHIAARAQLSLATNCIEITPGESYTVTRVRWGGSLLEEASLSSSPKLLTIMPLAIPATEAPLGSAPAIYEVDAELDDKAFRVRVTQRLLPESGKVSLTDARVVVSGGRGVGSTEGFASLEELASLLEGAVGCSRAVTNQGWRPHTDQVGQTGARVAPDLYIACGISGAIQHIVGCKGSRHILVINTDPDAPILTKASYAVIGNLHEVVPAISAALRKQRSS